MFNLLCSEKNIKVDLLLLHLCLCFVMFLNSLPFLCHQLPFVPWVRLPSRNVLGTLGMTVTNTMAGQWTLLLFAANSSFLPDEKSLLLEDILNHQSNEPLLKSGFPVTCCYHLTVLASNRIIYQRKLISWNLLNRMIFCFVAWRLC